MTYPRLIPYLGQPLVLSMSTEVVDDLKNRISRLSSDEKAELAMYFFEQDAPEIELDEWEKQIAEDMKNGNTVNIDRAIERDRGNLGPKDRPAREILGCFRFLEKLRPTSRAHSNIG